VLTVVLKPPASAIFLFFVQPEVGGAKNEPTLAENMLGDILAVTLKLKLKNAVKG